LSSLLAARPKLRNIIRRVIVNHESALLLLDWELNITPPNEQGILQQGTATQVLQREADGNWRLLICNPLGIA
jgi:ketosteroid isomerase-like protein